MLATRAGNVIRVADGQRRLSVYLCPNSDDAIKRIPYNMPEDMYTALRRMKGTIVLAEYSEGDAPKYSVLVHGLMAMTQFEKLWAGTLLSLKTCVPGESRVIEGIWNG